MSTGTFHATRHFSNRLDETGWRSGLLFFLKPSSFLLVCCVCRDDHSMMGEPEEGVRPRSWEVYSSMHGIDSLFSGLSKRTPSGGFFTS
jgi:hypothetical protein